MNAILLALVLAAPGPLLLVPNASGLTSYGASGLSCFHDADNSVSMCMLTDDTMGLSIYGQQRTDDANALGMVIKPEAVSPFAAAAKTASPLRVSGGADSKTIVWDNADPSTVCGGTSVTYLIDGTSYTQSYGVAGVNGYCNGGCTTKAQAAASFAAALEARTGIGATVGTVGADTAGVGVTLDPSTASFFFSNETAACTTYSNGGSGCTVIEGIALQTGVTGSNNTAFIASSCQATPSGNAFLSGGGFDASTRFRLSAPTNPENSVNYTSASDGTGGFWRVNAKGSKINGTSKVVTLTFPGGGGAASVTSTGAIPAGASNLQITCRNIAANTGAATSYDLGSGVGLNEYGSLIAGTLSTTTISPNSFSAFPVAGDIVATANGGNAASLSIRCTIFYDLITSADTSN